MPDDRTGRSHRTQAQADAANYRREQAARQESAARHAREVAEIQRRHREKSERQQSQTPVQDAASQQLRQAMDNYFKSYKEKSDRVADALLEEDRRERVKISSGE